MSGPSLAGAARQGQADRIRFIPTALPLSLTSFVGRVEDIARVSALLDDPQIRLLTLIGPGGVGKSRLALEVARRLAPDFANGVAFVRLTRLRDPALVPAAVARAVGAHGDGESLATRLDDQHLLLVLDDIEHLLHPAPIWLADLLGHCPRLKALVTSQVSLNIGGEHRYPVSPLPLPGPGSPEEQAASDAVVLFAQRSRALRPDFVLDAGNLPAVANICREVDGLPLAIELAASRILLLTPAEIAANLNDRLRLLTGGLRDVPERMRSLRATFDWSYDLLSADEQRLFSQLAVFMGGFDLAAAEAVSGTTSLDVLAGLASLVDKSLLRVSLGEGRDEARYVMLETLRAYALERLAESGDEAAVRDRHAGWYLDLVARTAPGRDPTRPADPADVERLEPDYGNVRAALGWLDATGREADLTRLAMTLRSYWYLTERFAEALHWYERARPADAAARADLLRMTAQMTQLLGRPGAEEMLEQSLALARESGTDFTEAVALFHLGILAEDRGAYDLATTRFRAAQALFADRANAPGQMECTYHLGVVAYGEGRLDIAADLLGTAAANADAANDVLLAAWADTYRTLVACARHDLATARGLLGRHVGMPNEPALRHHLPDFIATAGVVASLGGDHVRAARLLGASARGEFPFMLPERLAYDAALAAARQHLGEEELERARTAGRRLTGAELTVDLGQVVAGPPAAAPRPVAAPPPADLTPRELEVLKLLADGYTNQEIADRLYVSRRTAATHVDHILTKLDVPSRTAAVAWAVRTGVA
jgi:non-specific serine/threonine protein kinase